MIDFYDQCCCTSKKSAAGAASQIYTSQAGVRSNHNCRLATCALLDVIRCWLKLEHYSATVPTRVIITRPGVGLIHLDSSFKKKKNTFRTHNGENLLPSVSASPNKRIPRTPREKWMIFRRNRDKHETRQMPVLTSNVPRYETIQPHQ